MLMENANAENDADDSITAETRLLLISIVIKDNPKMTIDTAHSFHILITRLWQVKTRKFTQSDHQISHSL